MRPRNCRFRLDRVVIAVIRRPIRRRRIQRVAAVPSTRTPARPIKTFCINRRHRAIFDPETLFPLPVVFRNRLCFPSRLPPRVKRRGRRRRRSIVSINYGLNLDTTELSPKNLSTVSVSADRICGAEGTSKWTSKYLRMRRNQLVAGGEATAENKIETKPLREGLTGRCRTRDAGGTERLPRVQAVNRIT